MIMKKGTKITLTVIAIIVCIIVGVIVWQWGNISALVYSVQYSQEELDTMLTENKDKLDTVLNEIDVPVPRELTQEELAALESGDITQEEAVEISLGSSTLKEKIDKHTNSEKNNVTSKPNSTPQPQNNTSALIAKLYVLKASYMSKLDGLEGQAKAEYSNTPAEKRTAAWKGSMISKYSSRVAALEGECDAKVEGIIAQIKAEISKNGGDMSIINTIRSTYETEKQIKKAHYMNTYL